MKFFYPYPSISVQYPKNFKIPLLISSPHSGRVYLPSFLNKTCLPLFELQKTEDRFIDCLFENIPIHGGTFLTTDFPRSWCDVNRDYRELDYKMFRPALSQQEVLTSDKVRAGFGVIPRCVSQGKSIYKYCLHPNEIKQRLSIGWFPYHEKLHKIINDLHRQFGKVFIVDAHSMPPLQFTKKIDIVLGDNHGKSCNSSFIQSIEDFCLQENYSVRRNMPYSGGYITQRYGFPEMNVYIFQIEFCRSLYLNLSTLKKNNNFYETKNKIDNIFSKISNLILDNL